MPSMLLEAAHSPVFPAGRLVKGGDLLRHPEWGPCELIRGKVVPVCRPNYAHGELAGEIAFAATAFVKKHKLGSIVVGDSGIYLERDPDTVCGPDIYFISTARRPAKAAKLGFLEVAPELCIEIVSPKDRWSRIARKVEMYLAAGVKLVWVLDPKTRRAHVYRGDKTVAMLGVDGILKGEQILPGFELALKELFAVLD